MPFVWPGPVSVLGEEQEGQAKACGFKICFDLFWRRN